MRFRERLIRAVAHVDASSPPFGTPFNFVPRLLVLFLFFGLGSEPRAVWFLRWPVFLADLRAACHSGHPRAYGEHK
jgi:hypothetical protein